MSAVTASDFIRNLKSRDTFHVEAAKLEFALELKRAMEREGLNNTDLAERLKVSKPMVSKLLRGDANVTIETMVKACRSVRGSLFIKIVREGCSARLFEIAKNVAPKPQGALRVVKDAVISHRQHEGWNFAANDFETVEYTDEVQPVAA